MTVTVLWLIPAAILLAAAALKAADRDGTCVAARRLRRAGTARGARLGRAGRGGGGRSRRGSRRARRRAAHLAGALLAAFLVVQLLALARGEAGAPCGCFGRGGKLSRATAARTALLGCACAALPLTGTGPDLPLALTAAVAAGAVVLAGGRRASAPAAALDVDGEGPALGPSDPARRLVPRRDRHRARRLHGAGLRAVPPGDPRRRGARRPRRDGAALRCRAGCRRLGGGRRAGRALCRRGERRRARAGQGHGQRRAPARVRARGRAARGSSRLGATGDPAARRGVGAARDPGSSPVAGAARARGSSRRALLARAGAFAGAGASARWSPPGSAEAYHFCGHIYTTDGCPHPTGLPRIDRRGLPLRAADGRQVDDLGRLIDRNGNPSTRTARRSPTSRAARCPPRRARPCAT